MFDFGTFDHLTFDEELVSEVAVDLGDDTHDGGSSKYYKYWKGLQDREHEKRRQREDEERRRREEIAEHKPAALAVKPEPVPASIAAEPEPAKPDLELAYRSIVAAIQKVALREAAEFEAQQLLKTKKRRRDEAAILLLLE